MIGTPVVIDLDDEEDEEPSSSNKMDTWEQFNNTGDWDDEGLETIDGFETGVEAGFGKGTEEGVESRFGTELESYERLINSNKFSLDQETTFPDLHALFQAYNFEYFDSKLVAVEVKWSPKMTLCAGLCVYQSGGYCSIRLSEPLLKFRTVKEFRVIII